MSELNYITEMLELKDNNIKFYENCYHKEKIKGVYHKIFDGVLTYQPICCEKCGAIFDNNFEKHGFITSNIKIPDVSGFKSILRLKKQRYLCKHCGKTFTLRDNVTEYGCFISKNTKWKIANELRNKISEKDIAINNNVSPNTVERIMDSYYDSQKLYKNYLPKVLSFDEFKSVKSADGAMSFHMCNGETGQTIDIVENRKLLSLLRYFAYYSFNARKNVKFIIIDMYSPYVFLIQKMFPNAKIIIDTFHLVQLISRSLNKTRIRAMKSNKNSYNKMKRYWRLILKDKNELDSSKWRRYTCFPDLITEIDVVNYILDQSVELKSTYYKYQELLQSIRDKNYSNFIFAINNVDNSISDYMKTSIRTLTKFKDKIYNTFNNNYHNAFIEGNNNFIKVLKRIAFGFRSFRRFKARIMICKGLVQINRKKANAFALASQD